MKAEFSEYGKRKLLRALKDDEKNRQIMSILLEALNVRPAVFAANAMHSNGVSSEDLSKCIRHPGFGLLPDAWLNNTINELRDIERQQQ